MQACGHHKGNNIPTESEQQKNESETAFNFRPLAGGWLTLCSQAMPEDSVVVTGQVFKAHKLKLKNTIIE